MDVSHLASVWRSLLPTEREQAEMDSVRVERNEGEGHNNYSSFNGEGTACLFGAGMCGHDFVAVLHEN